VEVVQLVPNVGDVYKKANRPVRVLQYGEGNFLRAFVDWMIDILNEKGLFNGNVEIVKPIRYGSIEALKRQDSIYTVLLRGAGETDVRVVRSVQDSICCYDEYEKYSQLAKLPELRFVFSNTTEAGIAFSEEDDINLCPPNTFPGKLTKFLFERYSFFKGDPSKGLVIVPVELIDNNGGALKECVQKCCRLWGLEQGFSDWVENVCVFASTLVDRIVTGFPHSEKEALFEELGYTDDCLVTAEKFALWVIESEAVFIDELPFDKAGLPVIFTDDLKMYKQRKVRVLNGAHTGFALLAYLCGFDYVDEAINDPDLGEFVDGLIFKEIVPALDMPQSEAEEFAEDVIKRFKNPHIKHSLLSIALNSVSKWHTRCLPSLLRYYEMNGAAPLRLAFSLAALIAFYKGETRGGEHYGKRFGQEYKVLDDASVLEFFNGNSSLGPEMLVGAAIRNFGLNLPGLDGLEDKVSLYLSEICELGAKDALKKHLVEF
jgi:tagaturonate reductase